MIVVNKNFDNHEFLNYVGVNSANDLENLDEYKLFDLIKNFEGNKNVSVVGCQYYNSNKDGHISLRCISIKDNGTETYKIDDEFLNDNLSEKSGKDFLNLHITCFYNAPYYLDKVLERKERDYFESNSIDIMILNKLISSSEDFCDYDNEFF